MVSIAMMKPTFLMLAMLVASMTGKSEAFSCYQCNYTNTEYIGSSTCAEPFNATAAAKCDAPVCAWHLANYTSPEKFILLYRECISNDTWKDVSCEQYAAIANSSFVMIGDSCCYSTGLKTENGITSNITSCFCKKDNCNGNVLKPESISNAMSRTLTVSAFMMFWIQLAIIIGKIL